MDVRPSPRRTRASAIKKRKKYAYIRTQNGIRQRLDAIEVHAAARKGVSELRYTEYLEGGHDAWTRAMADQRLAAWAFAFTSKA